MLQKRKQQTFLTGFGLAEYSERHPLSLSGGQKQRVTIAASIAAKSDILVLDEPTSGLDGRNMLRLKNILRELKKQGMLIFIVTHDAEFLEGLTDELLTISNKEENMDKREKQQSPLRGILQFASQRKGLLRISVILSVLSSAFGMVPYAAVYMGVDPKTVQYLAGHKNSKTTMDIYAKIKYNKPQELLPVVNAALQPVAMS